MKVAVIQAAPIYNDLKACIEKATELIKETSKSGAQLAVLGESWFAGYPSWLDYLPKVAFWDHEPTKEVYLKMYESALSAESKEMQQLQKLAKQLKIGLVFGANEKTDNHSSLYNSLFTINQEGQLVNHHRKLMPTYTERLLHTPGDAAGIKAPEIHNAKVGGLICWEHWMPLTRQALHNQKEDIHVAVWPTVFERHQIASRHYAFEGKCYVLAAGQLLQVKDLPTEFEIPEELAKDPNRYMMNGGSCIIGPDAKYLAEPVFDQETILYAELDLNQLQKDRLFLDVSGHYQRPDIFTFDWDKKRR